MRGEGWFEEDQGQIQGQGKLTYAQRLLQGQALDLSECGGTKIFFHVPLKLDV